jgi:hypothetical protein
LQEHGLPKPWQALAWSLLGAIVLLAAAMLQAIASTALIAQQPAAAPTVCLTPSATNPALHDGDDVRARFLSSLCNRRVPEINGP